MKTIKRERQVRLDELLKYVWDNGIASGEFRSEKSNKVFIDCDRWVLLECGCVTPDERFTITEEVEITEEMELKQLVVIYKNGGSGKIRNMNIKELVERHESVYGHGVPIKFIYLQNEDGSIGDLIWDKERGLID